MMLSTRVSAILHSISACYIPAVTGIVTGPAVAWLGTDSRRGYHSSLCRFHSLMTVSRLVQPAVCSSLHQTAAGAAAAAAPTTGNCFIRHPAPWMTPRRTLCSEVDSVRDDDCEASSPVVLRSIEYDALSDADKLVLVKKELLFHTKTGGVKVPSQLTEAHWQELLSKSSVRRRNDYLRYLCIKERRKNHLEERRRMKRIHSKDSSMPANDEDLASDPCKYSTFVRIPDMKNNVMSNHKMVSANLYGQHIIFDYGFQNHMNNQQRELILRQLHFALKLNSTHIDPYYIHFCNVDVDDAAAMNPNIFDGRFLVDVHKEHYLDLFDKDKLVYLTPHCKEDLDEYDHDALYIIGCIVDKGIQVPLTAPRAAKDGIKMRRLPLTRHCDWGIGHKLLCLPTVLGTLLDLRHTGSWDTALANNIPAYKLRKERRRGGAGPPAAEAAAPTAAAAAAVVPTSAVAVVAAAPSVAVSSQ